ncbi:MAG TPA: DUF3168 domain-containing protein [Vicinamibacterales bacterium]|nr:DUF3168 domain-containing protein [Vicinamibacterales bacterium]
MTLGVSALSPVARAAYQALSDPAFLALSTGGVYDDVPEGAARPHTVLSVQELDDSPFGAMALDVLLRVDVYSEYAGSRQAQQILAKAIELLHHRPLTVEGFSSVFVTYEGAETWPDQLVGGVRVKLLRGRFRVQVFQ